METDLHCLQAKKQWAQATKSILVKKKFDQMHSLDCDEMNILCPNDSIILTFYYNFLSKELELNI